MEQVEIVVEGMSCDGCVTSVQNALTSHDGVATASANLDTGIVTIEFDPGVVNRSALASAIEDAGFDVAA